MGPVLKAPEELAKEPGIRPSAAEVQQIATDAALTVNSSIAAAQERLIAAELAEQGWRKQIDDLKVEQNRLIGEISSVQSQCDSLDALVTGANATVKARQDALTDRKSEEAQAFNSYNLKYVELANKRVERKNIPWGRVDLIWAADKAILDLETQVDTLWWPYKNATSKKEWAEDDLREAINERDRLAAEAVTFKQINLDPLKTEELSMRNQILSWATSFAAAEEVVKALRKELGMN
jgi:chromosome segregation ATPase